MNILTFTSTSILPSRTPRRWQTPRCELGRRALGVDYGLSRIGLAVSVGISPRLLPQLRERDANVAARHVAAAANEYMADDIVLGLPLNSSGEHGDQAKLTLVFAKLLTSVAPRHRLYLLDERFTTAEANEILGGNPNASSMRDSLSAAAILNRYFTKNGEVSPELFYDPPVQERRKTKSLDNELVSFEEWRKTKMRQAKEHAAILAEKKRRKKRR